MPPKKLTAKQARAALPEWSQKIVDFRNSLKLSQSELGKQLGASTMAVSRWERAIQKAPANIYIQLGNLAGDPLCWYFWGCAGLSTADVLRVLPAARRRMHEDRFPNLRVVHAGGQKRIPSTDFVAVPLLPVHAGTPGSGRQNCRFRAGAAGSNVGSAHGLVSQSEIHDLPTSEREFDVAANP